jgi:hypothetical protein
MANDKNRPLAITYSSGITCGNPANLSTLAVFFDRISLPYPYEWDPDAIHIANVEGDKIMASVQEDYVTWRSHWKLLFEQGILQTLPPAITPDSVPDAYDGLFRCLRAMESPKATNQSERSKTVSNYQLAIGSVQLAIHAAYARKPSPELFMSTPADLRTERLAGFIVRELFSYQIPKLQSLHPEQILEVREELQDTKEGFVDYIFELSDDIAGRIKNGSSAEDAARETVQRKLLPKYHEFRRQIEMKRTGFWSSVLVAGGKFMAIDATPLSPKFWGEIFQAVFGTFAEQAQIEAMSNATQAFQYVAHLQSLASKNG